MSARFIPSPYGKGYLLFEGRSAVATGWLRTKKDAERWVREQNKSGE